MPTLDDLHEAFADLERLAPAPQPLGRPGRRSAVRVERRGPRTRAAVVLTSAAVVAVAAGAVLVGRTDHARPAAGAAGGTTGGPVVPTASPAVRLTHPSKPVASNTGPLAVGTIAPGPSPVQISGLPGLRVVQLDPHLGAGGLTVRAGDGVEWTFGWNNAGLDPADKPDTGTATYNGQTYLVYPNRDGGGLVAVGVSARGFGMTITAVGQNYGFDDYEPFLAHVAYAGTLGDRASWFRGPIAP